MKPAAHRELLQYVAPDEFKNLRQDAGLTHQQAANLLGCSVQTVRNWETGKTRIPWPAFELMRIRNCHHLPGQAWKAWQIRDEVLFDPSGNAPKKYSAAHPPIPTLDVEVKTDIMGDIAWEGAKGAHVGA